ncbi:AAA domain [Caudoviricetes sp.]|nr:AAA domain [Caudoviricetes sp.]UOF80980.1 AAA domain [Caudoviricetes sp.]UOF81369.1 AAA domain [Caudoviricetes sp.]
MSHLKTLVNGYSGSGKSYFALSHPKVAWLITEPGTDVLLDLHPELKKNVVWKEEFIPSKTEDIKAVFERLDAATTRAQKEAAEGVIETLVLDNITFLSENRWLWINKYDKQIAKNGEVDTRGMYGSLGRWLYQFTLLDIISFKGNVVITCHEMEEESLNEKGVATATGNVIPNIIGGFREKVEGMLSASIYLDKRRVGPDKYEYWARCQKGAGRNAKNRFGLPEILQNISYQTIMESIQKNSNKTSQIKETVK